METEKTKSFHLVFGAVASDVEVTVGRVLPKPATLIWRCSLEIALRKPAAMGEI